MTEKARRAASPVVCADRDSGVAANAGVGGFGGLNSDAEKIFLEFSVRKRKLPDIAGVC